ncbi:energy transducer TonB [Methylomonas sp. LL1]|uniref:energy transducer TonB n=1 Tax=Methylomonas sp. LL1 TaxID=2785785 RepID=UPI0018C37F39|nr:energy transducer TonB [Methylomonas sp. LL1]QPK61506.1 energy transducer TonB [Methylomonas sp. LL1]
MIANFCFLQYAAVAAKPQQQPSASNPYKTHSDNAYVAWLGIGTALALHLAGVALLPGQVTAETIAPPKPIMVNWISASAVKTPTSPAPQSVHRPEAAAKKVKPRPLPKLAKPQPVLATPSETVSPMMVPSSEPEPRQTSMASEPSPSQPANSSSSPSSATSDETSQLPLTLPNLNADYLNNPAPDYPAQSRQLGEQGRVLLRVLVNAAGVVEQVTLRKSSGYPRLDAAAQDSVKNWRFIPAKRGEQAVVAWVVVPISFSLEG